MQGKQEEKAADVNYQGCKRNYFHTVTEGNQLFQAASLWLAVEILIKLYYVDMTKTNKLVQNIVSSAEFS